MRLTTFLAAGPRTGRFPPAGAGSKASPPSGPYVLNPSIYTGPAVQEELAGTTWDTMRRVYDFVDVTTLRGAVALLEADTTPAPRPVKRRGGLKKAA